VFKLEIKHGTALQKSSLVKLSVLEEILGHFLQLESTRLALPGPTIPMPPKAPAEWSTASFSTRNCLHFNF